MLQLTKFRWVVLLLAVVLLVVEASAIQRFRTFETSEERVGETKEGVVVRQQKVVPVKKQLWFFQQNINPHVCIFSLNKQPAGKSFVPIELLILYCTYLI